MLEAEISDKDAFEEYYEKYGFVSSIADWAEKHGLNVEIAVQEHKEIKGLIASEIIRRKISTILDLGCGCGFFMSRLNTEYPEGKITGVDVSRFELNNAKLNKVRGSLVMCCAESMPFLSNSFECIVCSEVIEHVADPVKSLSEISRLLSNGGYMLLSTDNPLSIFNRVVKWISRVRRGEKRRQRGPKTEYVSLSTLWKLIPISIKVYRIAYRCPYPNLPNKGAAKSRTLTNILLLSASVTEKLPFLENVLCNKYFVFAVKRAR